jgi:methylaspartate ammonia-lyase
LALTLEQVLSADRVSHHYLMATRDQGVEVDRLYSVATLYFHRSLLTCYNVEKVLVSLAEALCAHLEADVAARSRALASANPLPLNGRSVQERNIGIKKLIIRQVNG